MDITQNTHRSSALNAIRPFTISHTSTLGLTSSSSAALASSSSSSLRHNYQYIESSNEFLAEDAKSNKSAATTKSTREVFDLLAKLLPLGILLLIVALMVHFVTYVRELEPWRSISEIICMILAATVVPLSIVFIAKTMCDWRKTSNSFWYSNYDFEDPLYISNGSDTVANETTMINLDSRRKCSASSTQACSINDDIPLKET
ncbi:hypothetical protein HDE_09013 [Halotydeus destructor]|nr:hypothetical protein HDE_09013 [Halotydeus destructor]